MCTEGYLYMYIGYLIYCEMTFLIDLRQDQVSDMLICCIHDSFKRLKVFGLRYLEMTFGFI